MKALLTIGLIAGSFYVHADGGSSACHRSQVDPVIDERFALAAEQLQLDWWGAGKKEVEEAHCRRTIPTSSELDNYIHNLSQNGPVETTTINGVEFENESETMIELYSKLTQMTDFIGRVEDEQEDLQQRYVINPECKKVGCAIRRIYGNEIGPKVLFLLNEYGLNASHLAFMNSDIVTTDEIDRMIKGAGDFPAFMLPLEENKQFTKFSRGYTLSAYGAEGASTVANAFITFFDGWNDLDSPEMMEYTAVHEIGHYIAHHFELDDSPTWLALSGWEDLGDDEYRLGNEACTVSRYGKTNPAEDFAESVATYRYNPGLLKERCPRKYQYIKEVVFHGIEYTSTNKCGDDNTYERDLYLSVLESREESPGSIQMNERDRDELYRLCKDHFMESVFSNGQRPENLMNCLQDEVVTREVLGQIDQLDPPLEFPEEFSVAYRGPQESTLRRLRPGPQARAAMTRDLVGSFIENKLVDVIINDDQEESYAYMGTSRNKSPAEFCGRWSQYRHHGFRDLVRDHFGDEFLAFSARERISEYFNGMCVEIQSESRTRVPFQRERVLEYFRQNSLSF